MKDVNDMKLIKEYDIEGYNIRIKGKYISKELDDDKVFSSERTDSVRLEAYIEKDGSVQDALVKEVVPNTIYIKKLPWSKKEYLTFKETYDVCLKELEEEISAWIEIRTREEKIKEFDKKMTDGLPDSLSTELK